jgi:ABC-type multidrug transport system permease subunit
MSHNLISLILAAGAGTVVYSYMGKRIGYGNVKRLWITILAVFALVYLIAIISLSVLVHSK